MAQLFSEERDRIRRVIDEQMKQLLRETAQALPMLTLNQEPDLQPVTRVEGARTPLPQGGFAGAVESSSVSQTFGTLGGANLSSPPNGPRSKAALLLGALSVLALLSVGGLLVVVLGMKDEDKVAENASASSSTSTASAVATSAQPSDRVQLKITFAPAAATAKLDGVPLSQSPFTAQVPRDGSMHRVEVNAPGLAPQTLMVSFEKDVTLDIVLVPETAASASASPTATQPNRLPGPLPANTNGKQPLGIDEQDPYKKKK
jgi:hypothetical protein